MHCVKLVKGCPHPASTCVHRGMRLRFEAPPPRDVGSAPRRYDLGWGSTSRSGDCRRLPALGHASLTGFNDMERDSTGQGEYRAAGALPRGHAGLERVRLSGIWADEIPIARAHHHLRMYMYTPWTALVCFNVGQDTCRAGTLKSYVESCCNARMVCSVLTCRRRLLSFSK